MAELIERLREALRTGQLDLPLPGAGATRVRHELLLEFGREDLSLARLAEAHTDAVAIVREAGRTPAPGTLYGVWAAEGPGSILNLQRQVDASWVLNGAKRYCSGAPLLNCALVTARYLDKSTLVEVSLESPGLTIETKAWATPAFADTATATVYFNEVHLPPDSVVGHDDWYLTRPGFWHGALGPAACWAGGAIGLVDAARDLNRRDPHSQAQLGALEANAWALRAVLNQAGDEIDADAADRYNLARRRALKARHIVERLCTDTLDRFGRATGPQLLAFDAATARRYAELTLYIRQCHGERDLNAIVAAE